MANVKPGKGVHIDVNQEILDWLQRAIDDLRTVYTDEEHNENPKQVLDNLVDTSFERFGCLTYEWAREKDKFGDKAYTVRPYPYGDDHTSGELRLTVVLRPNKELKLDLRPWGVY
jgi:hypothetical protein